MPLNHSVRLLGVWTVECTYNEDGHVFSGVGDEQKLTEVYGNELGWRGFAAEIEAFLGLPAYEESYAS